MLGTYCVPDPTALVVVGLSSGMAGSSLCVSLHGHTPQGPVLFGDLSSQTPIRAFLFATTMSASQRPSPIMASRFTHDCLINFGGANLKAAPQSRISPMFPQSAK